jgi:hypothetical protein
MKFVTLVFLLFISQSALAENLSAHVHGSVHLDMATNKKQLLVMLKSPSESFVGFESKAKTKKEKAKIKKAKSKWTKNLLTYLGKNLSDCKITSSTWKQKFEGKAHSSILAEAYIDCEKKVAGRELNINFSSSYPNIKTIHTQLLRENGSVINKKYKNDFKIKL